MERNLAAIDVLPAHVGDAAVVEGPGRVVVLDVGGKHADSGAVRLHAVDGGHLGEPAVNPAARAARDEDDVAIREPRGLDVVVFAERELLEAGAVRVDGEEVIALLVAGTVGEHDLPAVVVDARVAHRARDVLEDRAERLGAEVVRDEPPLPVEDRVAGAIAVVAEVGVPVLAPVRARGEQDFLDVAELPGEQPLAQLRDGRRGRTQTGDGWLLVRVVEVDVVDVTGSSGATMRRSAPFGMSMRAVSTSRIWWKSPVSGNMMSPRCFAPSKNCSLASLPPLSVENATATHFAATDVLPYLTPRPPLKKARMLPPDVPGILSYGPAFAPRPSGSISPFSASSLATGTEEPPAAAQASGSATAAAKKKFNAYFMPLSIAYHSPRRNRISRTTQ